MTKLMVLVCGYLLLIACNERPEYSSSRDVSQVPGAAVTQTPSNKPATQASDRSQATSEQVNAASANDDASQGKANPLDNMPKATPMSVAMETLDSASVPAERKSPMKQAIQNLVNVSQSGDAESIDSARNALVNAALGDAKGDGVNIQISGSIGGDGIQGKVNAVGGAANALVKAVQGSDLDAVKKAVLGIVNAAK